MAGLLVGGLLGIGVFCVWWACWQPDGPAAGPPSPRRVRPLPLRRLMLSAAAAGAGFLVLLLLTGIPALAGCVAGAAAALPTVVHRLRTDRLQRARRACWPDVVDNLASAVRAGLTLTEALAQVGRTGPVQLREPFQQFAHDQAVSGNVDSALDGLKARLADPIGDRLCEALRITREVGGTDVGKLLRNLSAFLREDARTRAEVEARHSWTVYAARLAVAAPWLVLVLLLTRPETAAAYRGGAGGAVLLIGALITAVSYLAMARISRLPPDVRVLR